MKRSTFVRPHSRKAFATATSALALLGLCSTASQAAPTAEQALALKPIQDDVQYDQPAADAVARCAIKAEKQAHGTSWVVRSPEGSVLRSFTDTNNDNLVDQWSYFKNGFEVYRDIDANFNGKADQYRWFHTGGTRWGLDTNEDGKIDTWKVISAEEVAAEVVRAIQSRNPRRFASLVLAADELNSLGLGPEHARKISAQIESAEARFQAFVARQKKVTDATAYTDFSAGRPGMIPAGTGGSTRDLVAYENAVALVENQGKHEQVFLGTLVQSGNVWRLLDIPTVDAGDNGPQNGYFFQAGLSAAPDQAAAPTGGPSETAQKLLAELEQLDREASGAPDTAQPKVNARRAEILEQLADDAQEPAAKEQWIRQLADSVGVAVQAGTYPEGVARLEALEKKLADASSAADLRAYVAFRRMSAAYGQSLQAPDAEFGKIQSQWIEQLKQFVNDYSKTPDTAEALLQLAIAQEFAGEDEEAIKWYEQILADFPDGAPGRKAAGARTRLKSVGQPITLQGKDLAGKPVDLARYRGKTVLIQYWATWCEPCIADMARIKELAALYAKEGFAVIGVSLDNRRDEVVQFLKQNRLPWQQIYEEGGLESRLATEMGILTLPTMVLVDKKGQVVNRSVHITELDSELKKLLR